MRFLLHISIIFSSLFLILKVSSDSFNYNSYTSHGIIGLINMPTARHYEEGAYAFGANLNKKDQKIFISSSPYDWLEATLFYSNIEDKPYCETFYDPVCSQDYKDKGFNFKFRLKEEGRLPAISVGFNDIGGTGLYSSEYIVASYGRNYLDFHFGIGWGNLSGSDLSFENPLIKLSNKFELRSKQIEGGGQIEPSSFFSGKKAAPFFGLSYALNRKTVFKIEHDTTVTPGLIGYQEPKSDFSFGIQYNLNDNFTIGISNVRGDTSSLSFVYRNNPKKSNSRYKYKKTEFKETDGKYVRFIKSLNNNGIGVNKIIETSKEIGVELTQFTHPNLDTINEIIRQASYDAGLNKEIKKDLRTADLQALTEYDQAFEQNSKLIYERQTAKKFKTSNNISFRPFLASREEFFKGALMLENNSEFIIKENFFFSTNLKYSLADNFDDLKYPPVDTYPAQVRSDIKDYLKNFNNGVFIGRAQFDYHFTPKKNHHIMTTAGILEEMFNGIGFEYLYFKHDLNYAIGFEVFNVKKRDYEMRFGTLEYKNIVGHLNFYYRNYDFIPFDAKVSYGEYLAGDEGYTIDLSRSFPNGVKFGFFASFTDVSSEQFGEGAFDKGIYFDIPIFDNLINYSWRPLTKDPGAKLNRKHTLHDLLIKFKPID